MEVIPELGILVDGEYHFSKLGHFYITEFNRDRNANITTITANDKMIYLEGTYDSKLTYPKPYREVALEIANLAGVEVNQASFASLGIEAIKKVEGYTYRQAIGLIAQFEGGFASFNRDGELEIRRLRPTEFGVTPESYLLKGFTKNENSYKIGGITVRIGEEETDILKVGTDTGSQVELENKAMTQDLLNQVWNLVKDIDYFPFELKWRGCPALEAGDWIYVTDRNGNRYSVPNLSYSMNFNGGLSAESKATTNSSSQATYKYRGSLNQKVQWLESILGSNDWNHNYYDEKPDNPKVGDLWFKKTGKDIEIWQYVEIDGVRDWELQISSAPNQDLLDMIEDLVEATANAQAAAEEAKTAGEEAAQLANEAKTESAKAIDDANAAINSVTNLGQIVQAVDKASQLAIEQSANAVADAQAAMVKANELLTSVNEIEGTITNITADINAINGELAVKVDQTIFNQLKGTVDTHTTSISANAQAIKLKANQSTVDTISGKVNANSAELSVQADKIAGLVTKTDGQSTKISALELQAGQFNLTLSSVQSDIDGINSNDNLIDKTFTFTNNKDISITTGLEATGKKTIINEFIPVTPNNTYVFYKPEKSGNVGFRAYTAEKAYIGAPGKSNETDRSAMFKTPANCYFIRFIDESNKLTKGYRLQVASATVTALTSVQATVDGLVTTVANKANQSQVTQLADQITSVVSTVDGHTSQITQMGKDINLRVTKDDVVNQINISPDGILIAANKIQITGLTKIDNAVIGTAHIKDLAVTNAKIANLAVNTAKIGDAAIVTAKIGDLAVTNAKIANLAINDAKIQNASISSAKIISLDANKISAGTVSGLIITSTNSTGRFLVEGQNAVFQNTSTNRKTEINENGVNIYNANGTLRAQFNQNVVNTGIVGTNTYNVYLGTGGVDGTEGESEGGEVRVVRYDSTPGSGAVTDYTYRPIRAEGFVGNYLNANTPFSGVSHLYLRPRYGTGEVRVTGSGSITTYQDLRARGLYADTLDTNTSTAGTNIYIRPAVDGEVRTTAINSSTNYVPIRTDSVWASGVASRDTNTNFYIGTDGELRVTSRGMGGINPIVYRNVRAAGFLGGALDSTATNIYVRPASGGEVRATATGTTGTYVPVRASSFPTSSMEEYKQDIVKHTDSALQIINAATIYDYRLRSEVALGRDKIRTGLVIGPNYNTPDCVIDGDGVEQYMMNSLSWKAIQELSAQIKELENQIRVLQLQVA